MIKPMKKPEKTSPRGVLEIGTGPAVYTTPTAKEIIPEISTIILVFRKSIIPAITAIIPRITMTETASASFILSRTMALCFSNPYPDFFFAFLKSM